MAISEYKGVVTRILAAGGIDADVDLLWSQKASQSRSDQETAVLVLNAALDIELGDLLDRIKTGVPPLSNDEATQIRFTIRDLRMSGQTAIASFNAEGGNAMADRIDTNSVFVSPYSMPDPNDPLFYGVPSYMRRA
jgi:hypothetical protein